MSRILLALKQIEDKGADHVPAEGRVERVQPVRAKTRTPKEPPADAAETAEVESAPPPASQSPKPLFASVPSQPSERSVFGEWSPPEEVASGDVRQAMSATLVLPAAEAQEAKWFGALRGDASSQRPAMDFPVDGSVAPVAPARSEQSRTGLVDREMGEPGDHETDLDQGESDLCERAVPEPAEREDAEPELAEQMGAEPEGAALRSAEPEGAELDPVEPGLLEAEPELAAASEPPRPEQFSWLLAASEESTDAGEVRIGALQNQLRHEQLDPLTRELVRDVSRNRVAAAGLVGFDETAAVEAVLAIAVGGSLAASGHRTLIIDASSRPQLTEMAGRSSNAVSLREPAQWRQAIRSTDVDGVELLPLGGAEAAALTPSDIDAVVDQVAAYYDAIVICAGDGRGHLAAPMLRRCRTSYLLVGLGLADRTAVQARLAALRRDGVFVAGTIAVRGNKSHLSE